MQHLPPTWSLPLTDGSTAHVLVTDRTHGNMATGAGRSDSNELRLARRQAVDGPWAWVTQVHEANVEVVEVPGDVAGSEADALCTVIPNAPLSIQTADCAPVGFVSRSGVVGVAHCGWRGLDAGVVSRTVEVMRNLGAEAILAVTGPCIHAAEYEFGAADLQRLTDRLGVGVASRTRNGAPALDLQAAVAAACEQEDVQLTASLGACTASNPDQYWSHRARGDLERQAMVVWIEPPGSPVAEDG